MECAICYDLIKEVRICLRCYTYVCKKCGEQCYVPPILYSIICSKKCLDNLLMSGCVYFTYYINNMLSANMTIGIKRYQSELLDHWNHEKDKPIIRQMINDYLINDIISIILDY